mmetsp:Transcript_27002/g.58925  ORF Transcript_27002/g.58925 Transcript_27002/m.58925 type:complete len:550 (+) Transcript_27002:119-1768(+)
MIDPHQARLEGGLGNEGLERGLEGHLHRLALQLVGGGEAAVVGGPGGRGGELGHGAQARDEVDGHQLLRGAELARLVRGQHGAHHLVHHRLVLQERLGVRVADARLGRKLLDLEHVRLDERDGAVHVAVAVAEDAAVEGVDVGGGGVLLLHGLQRDVLAALELDQVLQAVHQLQGPVRRPDADVTGVEPAVLLEGLVRLVLLLEVAHRHALAAQHHLAAAGAGLPEVLFVRVKVGLALAVQHALAGVQLDLHGGEGHAHDAVAHVVHGLDGADAARLCEGVTLDQVAPEHRADERLHLRADGAAARDGQPQPPAHHRLHLLEDLLEDGGVAAGGEGGGAAGVRRLEEELHHRAALAHRVLHPLLQDVPDLRHRRHDRRPELLDAAGGVGVAGGGVDAAVGQLAAGALGGDGLGVGEPDGGPEAEEAEGGRELQDVRCGQVRQVALLLLRRRVRGGEVLVGGGDGGDERAVLEHDALGLASGARRVHQQRHGVRGGEGGGDRGRHAHLHHLVERQHLDFAGGDIAEGVLREGHVGGVDDSGHLRALGCDA